MIRFVPDRKSTRAIVPATDVADAPTGTNAGAANMAPFAGFVIVTEKSGAVPKLAVKTLFVVIATIKGFAVEFVSPVQFTKTCPAAGVAVSVTFALVA